MKISRELPHFDGKNALIIVSGEVRAKIYYASQGVIELLEEVAPHKADYPDQQGLERRMGHGQTFSWEA